MLESQIHPLAAEIDEGYNIRKQMKDLEKRGDEIKKKIREAAINEPGAVRSSGESVILHGNQHKAKVSLSEDSFSFKDDISTIDIRRVKALLGDNVAIINEGVKLKDGITLGKIKEILGEQYGELFEDNLQAKFDARNLTAWLNIRRKTASGGDDTADFIERNLERKPNTERVTFSK